MNLYPSLSFNDYHHFPDLVASILTSSICLKNFKFQTYHFISVPSLTFLKQEAISEIYPQVMR